MIEDQRIGSGHMQVQHPAPSDGLFEAVVQLGQPIQQGDLLGTISDVLGHEVVPIRAERTGLVLVLRCFARVSAGDSLGVVLETHQQLPKSQ